jgi:peptide/nickel transport system permease protein
MTRFILRRLASTIGVLFALSVLVFLIFFAIPGVDPARQIAGRNPTPETLAAVRHTFGLDQPLPLQYLHLMDHLLVRRDLGSYTNRGVNVISELADATPVTLSLIIGAAVLWVVFSMLIGIVCAVFRDSVWDRGLMVVSLIAVSVPVFWFGQVANLVSQDRWHSSVFFHWVPPLGYTPLTDNPLLWFKHLVIPWIVLAASYTGLYARIFRSALIEAGAQDFIRTARSKGISEARVVLRHLVRTSLGTFASLFALDFGVLVGGGALLVEVVFGLPGIGRLTYQSLAGLDLPVIMATVLYGGFFIVIMNAVVDVLYARLDPRVRVVGP